MSTKKATPQKSSTTPKEKLLKIFSCGSEKRSKAISPSQHQAPSQRSQEEDEQYAFVNKDIINAEATLGHSHNDDNVVNLSYTDVKLIGKGTFGIVYKAKLCDTSETIAIKKVFDDKKYKNRELWFMKQLQHPNIIDLLYFFYSEDAGCRKGERYLNMVLEYMPETLFTLAKCDGTYTKPLLDPTSIKVYTYQLFRCLNYLHSLNICHRDIKPQNLLIDPITHAVKLCDFGSAKELLPSESNVAYICSRYYRAPELIYGAKDYTCQIDSWSAGCVLAELFQGHPIFPGATGPDQMVEIMKILGTPTYEDFVDFTQNPKEMRLPPMLLPMAWHKVFTKSVPSPEAMHLISNILVFSPKKRLRPIDALAHPFYDELKRKGTKMADGSHFPPLFNFTEKEIELCPALIERVLPLHYDDDDWSAAVSNLANSDKRGQDGLDGGIKSKLVSMARNSFKRSSFKKDNKPQTQQKQQQQPVENISHNDDDDEKSDIDISNLASHSRQQMKWQEEDHHHHSQHPDNDDVNRTSQDNIQEGITGMSLNHSHKKKKGKKKTTKEKTKSHEEDGDDDKSLNDSVGSTEFKLSPSDVSRSTKQTPLKDDDVDDVAATSVNIDYEAENKVKKKKKTPRKHSRNEDESYSPTGHHDDQQDWGDVMGRDGNYGNYGEDGDDFKSENAEIMKVPKKKGKKPKSIEHSLEHDSDNLPSSPVVKDSEEKIVKKKKMVRNDGMETVVIETSTITTTDKSKSGGEIFGKVDNGHPKSGGGKKKVVARRVELEDEV